jgi:guanylate kinase
MRERQQTALKEMALAERYDYVVVNDDLERAVKEIQSIIRKERARRIKKNGSEPD